MIRPETTAALDKLETWLKRRRARGRWLVLTHDNPDPDALATGMILTKVLRRRFNQQVTFAYGGIVGRAENREMVRALKIKISRWRHLQIKNYRHVALVDCQPKTGNHSLPDHVTPALVIDHHAPRPATADVPLVDIRTDYSASASIAAEYLLASGIEATRAEATASRLRHTFGDPGLQSRSGRARSTTLQPLPGPRQHENSRSHSVAKTQRELLPYASRRSGESPAHRLGPDQRARRRRAARHRSRSGRPSAAHGRSHLVAMHRPVRRPRLLLDPHDESPRQRSVRHAPSPGQSRPRRRTPDDRRGMDRRCRRRAARPRSRPCWLSAS